MEPHVGCAHEAPQEAQPHVEVDEVDEDDEEVDEDDEEVDEDEEEVDEDEEEVDEDDEEVDEDDEEVDEDEEYEVWSRSAIRSKTRVVRSGCGCTLRR